MNEVAQWMQPGPTGAAWRVGLMLLMAAAGWALHTWRLRVRERDLLLLVDERARLWRAAVPVAVPAPAGESIVGRLHARGAHGAAPAPVEGPASVLAVASARTRCLIESGLAGLAVRVAAADSVWSARVACRDAFDAGQPYNLVLLDATLAEIEEPGEPGRLEEDLQAWGSRVAVIRPGAPQVEEGVRCHEDPDRRGRTGVTAAAGTSA